MRKPNVWKLFSLLLSLTILLFGSKDVYGQGPPEILPKDRDNAIGTLKNAIENISQEKPKVFTTNDKYIRFMMAPPGSNFFVNPLYRNSPQQAANWFLNNWSGLLANYSPGNSFNILRINTDKSKNNYVRYQQYYNGIEVYGAQLNCMVNASGGVVAILSDIMRDTQALDNGTISLNPNLTPVMAEEKAIKYLSDKHKGIKFDASNTQLKIFDPKVVGMVGEPKLVYHTIIKATKGISVGEGILIDAINGQKVFNYSIIHSALNRLIYDCDNTSDIVTTVYQYPDVNSLSSYPDASLAFKYSKDVYDFYQDNHGRDSYDDQGAAIKIWVRYCKYGETCPWNNAQWSGSQIQIASDIVMDDILGHEFTHGVTENTLQLVSSDTESGAINESLADMWGEWIDQTNGVSKTGYDQPADKWLIGEDDFVKPIRDMKDPHNPNTYTGASPSYLYEPGYWDDNQECHQNAGVGNKLCYLLTEGDVFNGFRISGFEISKASELFFECMRYWLLSSSDYYDLGFCLQQSAITLNWDSIDRSKVESACRAVEIYHEIAFEFKDNYGKRVAFFDDLGNLFLNGNMIIGTPSSDNNKDEFIVDTPYGISAILDLETGNMAVKFLDDDMFNTYGQNFMNYFAEGFIIKNSDGDVVAYINSGGLVLGGYVFDYRN